jgi:hypothetical protein
MAKRPALEWLHERVRGPVDAATHAVEAALGDELIAVCLIGAAAKPDRELRGGHAELLIVAESLEPATLRTLAAGLAEPLRAGLQVRTVTRAELHGSVDVHALELAQWRDLHCLLAGRDPFGSLELAAADLRHELERALRSLGHRLRNRLLWCLATQQRLLDPVLRESIERLASLAHHTLTLVGEAPPADDAALLEAFCVWAGVESQPLAAVRARLLVDALAQDPISELEALAALTEAATARVDGLRV